MKTLVVLPTYNEIENIPIIIPEIFNNLPNTHILIVDDNSPDGTSAKVKSMNYDNVFILNRHKKEGLGKAYIDGFKWALANNYDLIIQMDADLSHNPKYLPQLIQASEQADLIIGSRYLDGVRVVNWPFYRLMLSYFGNIAARVIAGIPIKDCTAGFKCFKKEVLENIDFNKISSSGYSFQVEMNYRVLKKGYKIMEIPIVFHERKFGESKMSSKIIREAVALLWKLRFKP